MSTFMNPNRSCERQSFQNANAYSRQAPQRPARERTQEHLIRATFLSPEVRMLQTPCRFRHSASMEYIGDWRSSNGQPVAVFQCPECGYREFIGIHNAEKRPFVVWYEMPDHWVD